MTRLCNFPNSFASTLELDNRKKQSTEESSSMLSRVGLEVTKSIIPELNWKTVRKGRRTTKPVSRNMSGFARGGIKSPKKPDESAIGHHFPDKVKEIPIKKRRHLLQSPSPPPFPSSLNNKEALLVQPQTPSQHADHLRSDSYKKQLLKEFGGCTAVKFTDNVDRVDDATISGVTDRKLYNPDDFSGIALLAAVACIDSMDDVNNYVEKELRTDEKLAPPEKLQVALSPNPIRRCNSCVKLENPIQKEVVEEENVKCVSADNSFSLSQSLHKDDGEKVRSVSLKVARLHWDLNVLMDAWEQPFDDSVEEACLKGVHDRVSPADATMKEYQENVVLKNPASKYDDKNITKEGGKSSSMLPDSSRKDGAQSDDPTSCAAKVGSSFDDCRNSDVSQDNSGNIVVSKDMTELQVGYDSPYEDGEVRVSTSYPWEEDECEDGENECVDYESDAREGVDSDDADYPGSEVVEAGSEGSLGTENRSLVPRKGSVSDINRSGSLKSSLRTHYMKDDTEKIDNAGIEGSTCESGTTIGQFELNEDNSRRGHTPDYMGVVDMKGSCVEETDSRASGGMLDSRIEGPSSIDLSRRKETSSLPQSRSHIYTRPGSDISPNKFMGRQRSTFHVRRGDEQWGYWDSRNRYPSNYHGPDGHGYIRNRTTIADSADKFGGLNSQDYRQGITYSSKAIHRTLGRTSPFYRDDYCSVHRRMPAADATTNQGREGFGNHRQRVGRGPREDHHEALADHCAVSSGRVPHYLYQRERSFSPSSGRVPQSSLPRRKSRSRSRTRSPHAWHSRRDWNQGMRCPSRSPDFRSEGRVDRVRMPLQKPSFPDYSESIMSPLSGRSSPQRNRRWGDGRDYNRRSPVRMFRRDERFYAAGSTRLKSDDYFRCPGRFPSITGTGRGSRFEESYDDRRRDDRVENRPRHSEAGGTVNRSRHDVEDNCDDDVRHAEKRDVLRTSREDKRSFNV